MEHGNSIRQVYQPFLVFFLVQSVRLFAPSDYHLAMLKHELAFTRQAAYAKSTKTAHMLYWKTYAKFCLYFCLQITPANPDTICIFAQILAGSFKAPQSTVNYVASVKLWHSLLDLDMTAFNSLECILTKKGIFRILAHIPNQAAPVTPEILAMFRQLLDISESTDATFWALFLIAFFHYGPQIKPGPWHSCVFRPG